MIKPSSFILSFPPIVQELDLIHASTCTFFFRYLYFLGRMSAALCGDCIIFFAGIHGQHQDLDVGHGHTILLLRWDPSAPDPEYCYSSLI